MLQIVWILGLIIVAALQLLAARQQTRWRLFSGGKHAFRAIWAILGFGIIVIFGGVPLNVLWAGVFAVAGLVLGFFTGRMAQVKFVGSSVALKRAPYAPWALAVMYILAFVFLLFGTADLYSVGLLLVLLAVTLDDGAIVAEIMKGSAASPTSAGAAEV